MNGMEMMLQSLLKSLNIDPKMIAGVAAAVQSAAADLRAIKQQNEEILLRLRSLTPDLLEVKPIPQLQETIKT